MQQARAAASLAAGGAFEHELAFAQRSGLHLRYPFV
jgi:hypothetical protein